MCQLGYNAPAGWQQRTAPRQLWFRRIQVICKPHISSDGCENHWLS